MKAITNTKYIKNLFLAALALISTSVFAQEEEDTSPKFSLNGSVDAYYRANLNSVNSSTDGSPDSAPGSSFANLPGFALGMANVIAAYEGEKVGFVADLVFGPRGTDAIFASPIYSATGNIVNQLYMYWNVSDKVKLTFGNFNTFLGYEVISPVANFNYSTSYLFSYGPFSHTGLKADFDLGNDFTAMLAVMNPTDVTEFNTEGLYTYGAQLGYSGQFLNLVYGKQALSTENLFQIDYTGGFDLSESFFLGLNASYQDTDGFGFYGVALYPQLATSETFTIGLRGEYFKELADGGPVYGADISTFALTLTGSATIGDLMIKPELRFDSASEDVFINNDREPNGSLASFVLAAIYSF